MAQGEKGRSNKGQDLHPEKKKKGKKRPESKKTSKKRRPPGFSSTGKGGHLAAGRERVTGEKRKINRKKGENSPGMEGDAHQSNAKGTRKKRGHRG